MKATATTNANIALIKYWGRRNDELVLPTNNSISFTMDDQLKTITTVEFDEKLKEDQLFIDEEVAKKKEVERASKFLDVVRQMAKINTRAKVHSQNSFPRSAGLASSASAFAALAVAASNAAGLKLDQKQLSMLARRGSGSASRSIHGGAVEWIAGSKEDGSDCFAKQLSAEGKWTHLRNVIAITNSHEKKVGSADGMKQTIKSSPLYKARLASVEERLKIVRNAIETVDFESMASAIMQESDNMHATMMDSWPPIVYLNSTSFEIIEKVLELNSRYGKNVAAYTFDAGPNAHVYTTAKYEKEIFEMLQGMNGVEKVMIAKVGEGAKTLNKHLF